ncbi:MAG: OBAP family protein [Nitrospira sp.]|nr:OBAP family protein [Nitrospira sp.]MDH4236782.1 OBAP family protein [Nitrospira sp.]MDH4327215.1 OBAP family protein [Nitrospira sp.]MDH5252254.1 OBAP family protein [Nitrospira sp.]
MKKAGMFTVVMIAAVGCYGVSPGTAVSGEPTSPAVGYDIHVQAPHMMADGTPGGPFHHYCKGISDKILQCLLFESTDPKAPLVGVEYFVAKDLSRKLPAIQWHRHFHDHKVEIATGRVQILDMPEDQAAKVAEVAAGTDGVIYHLWQHGQEFPDGTVSFPQSLGHKFTGYSDK